MKKHIFTLLLCLIIGTYWANAQTKVTGKVLDATDANPILAASIAVKGTTTGTYTDENGDYSITVPSNGTLIFSYLGYGTVEQKVNGRTVINVNMEPETSMLQEVVVTSTGKKPTRAVGYALTEIKGSDIANTNVVNSINAIQGKIAGVQINMGSSGPQSAQRIIIRGNTSLGSNNQPIFVIDGVIVDNLTTGPDKWGSGLDFGNDIKNLNSDDFESMTVLKGAAATALYGSRASNGVILITTKKGRKGEGVGISFSHSQQWEKAYGGPKFQNRYGDGWGDATSVWALDSNNQETRDRTYNGLNFGPAFDGKPYTMNGRSEMWEAVENNYLSAFQTGHQANTNVAVQGGSENNTFRLSYSNLQSNGLKLNNEFTRNSFSANMTQKISKFMDAEAAFSYVRSEATNPQAQGGGGAILYDYLYGLPRNYDTDYWLSHYKNSTGSGYNTDDYTEYSKTLWDWKENNKTQIEDTYRGNVNLDFHLTDWLTARIKGDFNRFYSNREDKILGNGSVNYGGSSYTIENRNREQYKITGMLSAMKNFNDINVNGSAAIEQWDSKGGYLKSWSVDGLKVPGQFDLSNSVSTAQTEGQKVNNWKRINSAYVFVNFDWKSQLYVDLTGRNDWSSTLTYPDGSGNNSYFYPSISTSWIFSDSFKKYLPEFVSFGKLRASYAIVGNDCDAYLTNIGYYKFNSNYRNVNDNKDYPSYIFDSDALRNLNLKPEKQHSIELGLEGRFLDNRIGFDIAYYKTNTKNQILALSQPSESGVTSKWINAGNIQNAGIELLINATPIETKDFTWYTSINYTRNRNKIIELTPGVDKYELEAGNLDTYSYATVGEEYGAIYTPYAYVRYQAVDANGNPIDHPNNGKKVLKSANGEDYKRSGEMVKVGSTQPDFLMGMTNEFKYKSLSLNILLDASIGGDIVSGTYNYGMAAGSLQSTLQYRDQASGGLPRTLSDGRVINDGAIRDGVYDNGTVIKGVDVSGMTMQEAYDKGLVDPISVSKYYYYGYSWSRGIREEAVLERSYVALREISLWWNMPRKWAKSVFVQNMTLGLICRNVGYIYNSLPQNIHPEGLYSNRTTAFVEVGGQPYARSYSFKLNITF